MALAPPTRTTWPTGRGRPGWSPTRCSSGKASTAATDAVLPIRATKETRIDREGRTLRRLREAVQAAAPQSLPDLLPSTPQRRRCTDGPVPDRVRSDEGPGIHRGLPDQA